MLEKLNRLLTPFFSQGRERIIILFGVCMGFILVYVLFSTLQESIVESRADLTDKKALFKWMEENAPIIQTLRKNSGTSSDVSNQNSLGTLDNSLRAKKLDNFVEKSEQLPDHKIQISFNHVPFDALINWLASLKQGSGFHVTLFSAEDSGEPGSVNSEVLLSLPKVENKGKNEK